ncbi:fasciclin domain-containing protein [Plantactinospora sp. CA-290183]|uniref:fasciclin domain-containing protein n=1 Tax=Plantactinospora sp. CA-290183 TaxID=3240006 RepID=UPI003D8F22FC
MSLPSLPPARGRRRTRGPSGASRLAAVLGTGLLLAFGTVACSDDDGGAGGAGATAAGTAVTGPLCDLLPSGTDPGNPASLAAMPVDEALRWITVLTTFEAALRASGLATELRGMTGLTILAPTDDAFGAKFSEDNLDELLITRKDELRALLRAHVVDGAHPLAQLRDVGRITTLDGTSLPVTGAGAMVRVGDGAETVCADYRIGNGRIHVVNKVLGNLPTTADGKDHRGH